MQDAFFSKEKLKNHLTERTTDQDKFPQSFKTLLTIWMKQSKNHFYHHSN